MKLYYHPLSTYSQKVLTALYEKEVDFDGELINPTDAAVREEFRKTYPLGKIPLLVRDDEGLVPESSIIIEYLDTHFDTGTQLIPDDADEARRVRFTDRIVDLYLNDTIVTLLFQGRKPEDEQDPARTEAARFRAGVMYEYLDKSLKDSDWLMGDFSMADCAAAPALLYAANVLPFDEHDAIVAYWERLAARPSYKRVLSEAQPHLEAFHASAA